MKERANASVCMSRIRNILIADQMYSAEHNGDLVPYSIYYQDSPAETYRFTELLRPYLGTATYGDQYKWLQCPSQTQRDQFGNIIAGIGPVFDCNSNGHFIHSDGTDAPYFRLSAKRSGIKYPDKTPSWMDVGGGSASGFPAYCRGCFPNGAVPGSISSDPNNFGTRHQNGSNVGFVDGHIALVPIAVLRAPCIEGGTDFFRHWDNAD